MTRWFQWLLFKLRRLRADDDLIMELRWAKQTGHFALGSCAQEYCVGEHETDDAYAEMARFNKVIDRAIAALATQEKQA